MSKHTPGPWELHLGYNGAFRIEKDGVVITDRGPYLDRHLEMHANARLIAAAPDLLEALKEAREVMGQEPSARVINAAIKIREAIKKAEGGE